MKLYKKQLRQQLLIPLQQGTQNVQSIKQYFYDFLEFVQEEEQYKGCLLVNTANELGDKMKNEVALEVINFSNEIIATFKNILAQDISKSESLIEQETNYLMVALQGIALASKALQKNQVDNYIEMTFKAI